MNDQKHTTRARRGRNEVSAKAKFSMLFNAVQGYSTLFNAKFRKNFRGDGGRADLAGKPERNDGKTSENMRTPDARISGTGKQSVHAISAYFTLLYAIAGDFYFFAEKGQTPRSDPLAIG